MDWSGCEIVEVVPGKGSGAPLLVGTRIPVEAITVNYESLLQEGMSSDEAIAEVSENYPGAVSSGSRVFWSITKVVSPSLSLESAARRELASQPAAQPDWSRCHKRRLHGLVRRKEWRAADPV